MNILGWLSTGVDAVKYWILTCAFSCHAYLFGENFQRRGELEPCGPPLPSPWQLKWPSFLVSFKKCCIMGDGGFD